MIALLKRCECGQVVELYVGGSGGWDDGDALDGPMVVVIGPIRL